VHMSKEKGFNWKQITSHHLFMPVVCLIVVCLANVIKSPDFFKISISDNGVLYGSVIDIINRASELVILALGITLGTGGFRGTHLS